MAKAVNATTARERDDQVRELTGVELSQVRGWLEHQRRRHGQGRVQPVCHNEDGRQGLAVTVLTARDGARPRLVRRWADT